MLTHTIHVVIVYAIIIITGVAVYYVNNTCENCYFSDNRSHLITRCFSLLYRPPSDDHLRGRFAFKTVPVIGILAPAQSLYANTKPPACISYAKTYNRIPILTRPIIENTIRSGGRVGKSGGDSAVETRDGRTCPADGEILRKIRTNPERPIHAGCK